jgi:hypothetical protein
MLPHSAVSSIGLGPTGTISYSAAAGTASLPIIESSKSTVDIEIEGYSVPGGVILVTPTMPFAPLIVGRPELIALSDIGFNTTHWLFL